MRFFVDSLIALLLVGLLAGVLLYHRKQQRLLIDGLIALLLVGVLAGIVLYRRENRWIEKQYQEVHLALARLHDQATYQGVFQTHESDILGFPRYISPAWFQDKGLPVNTTVPGWHSWIDVAPEVDRAEHPPDPVIEGRGQAGFWYNPNHGIFRARVMKQWSDTTALRLYNRLNKTELKSLPFSVDSSRRPQPMMLLAVVQADREAVFKPEEEVSHDTLQDRPSLIDNSDD